jgi:hypothetical protein
LRISAVANYQRDPRKERFWRRTLQQWRRSGRSVRDFCADRHLSEPSFYFWRTAIAERDRATPCDATPTPGASGTAAAPAAPPLFLPVCVQAAAAPLEVVLSDGLAVRVAAGFDDATLRRLLALLREPPC